MKKILSDKFLALFLIVFFTGSTLNGFGQPYFNVKDYGAKGDGKNMDSEAINKAIEEAAKNGGGTVFLPAGSFLSGSIRMKSNINLYLDAGAVLLAAPQNEELKDYYDKPENTKGEKKYQDEGHSYFENSLIWGRNLKNVSITGLGMIDGLGLAHVWESKKGITGLANKAISLIECTKVKIEGITIFRGGWFAILTTGCNLVSFNNLTIDTNRDGIDIDCCTNVIVSDCRVNSPIDDAICPKSSYALGRVIVTENMTITNCQVSAFRLGTLLDGTFQEEPIVYWTSRNGRIKFGTESNGGFRNITVSNCTFRNCKGIAIECVDGGILENISISNITMYNVDDYPVNITLGDRLRDPNPGKSRGINIFISNVVAYVNDSLSGIHITGTPTSYLENIRLSNISILYNGGGKKLDGLYNFPELGKGYPEVGAIASLGNNIPVVNVPSYGLFARHVKGLDIINLSVDCINEDLRPAMICIDVDGLEIESFKSRIINNIPVAQFENVRSLAFHHTPVFDNGLLVLHNGKWRLIKKGKGYQLYNLDVDKEGTNNIASKEPGILKEMIKKFGAMFQPSNKTALQNN
ncbi:rhamnogalacturonidase [Ferruginibacter sp.]|nr:right-handed parallel beta-helix repeat-containing protein [Ferruginibacter sp.]